MLQVTQLVGSRAKVPSFSGITLFCWSVCVTKENKNSFPRRSYISLINWILIWELNVFKIYLIILQCNVSSPISHYSYYLKTIIESLLRDFLIYPQNVHTSMIFYEITFFLVRCVHKYCRLITMMTKGPRYRFSHSQSHSLQQPFKK